MGKIVGLMLRKFQGRSLKNSGTINLTMYYLLCLLVETLYYICVCICVCIPPQEVFNKISDSGYFYASPKINSKDQGARGKNEQVFPKSQFPLRTPVRPLVIGKSPNHHLFPRLLTYILVPSITPVWTDQVVPCFLAANLDSKKSW